MAVIVCYCRTLAVLRLPDIAVKGRAIEKSIPVVPKQVGDIYRILMHHIIKLSSDVFIFSTCWIVFIVTVNLHIAAPLGISESPSQSRRSG